MQILQNEEFFRIFRKGKKYGNLMLSVTIDEDLEKKKFKLNIDVRIRLLKFL